MIRNQVTKQLVRFDGPHYKRMLRKQREPGSPKYFLKKDIARAAKERRSRGGASTNERSPENHMDWSAYDEEIMGMMNRDTCDICYEQVLPASMVQLGCRGHHTMCFDCLQKWCVDKLPSECTCPLCRAPIRSRDVLKLYMTDEMIRLNQSTDRIDRAMFVFHSAMIKSKDVETKSANEFGDYDSGEIGAFVASMLQMRHMVNNHLHVVASHEEAKLFGEEAKYELVMQIEYAVFVFSVRILSGYETDPQSRQTIANLLDRHYNMSSAFPTERVLSRREYENDPAKYQTFEITLDGQWVSNDDFEAVTTYINSDPAHTLALTHTFREGLLKFLAMRWVSTVVSDDFKNIMVSDHVQVDAAPDYRFLVNREFATDPRYKCDVRMPVKVTMWTFIPNSAPVSSTRMQDVLNKHTGTLNERLFIFKPFSHPQSAERLPYLYKFRATLSAKKKRTA